MIDKTSYILGMLTTAAAVVLYMELIHSPAVLERNKYIEVEIPAIKPSFYDEAMELERHSSLTASKLRHLLVLMQVKPTTSLAEFDTPGSELYDPYVNITVGVKYLARLHERFGDWNTTLTAYSHGPTATVGYDNDYIADNFYVKRVLSAK